uniref:Uncharacterized protein AlNc14C58G4344 n=1 Tax=Albugo laibachii Nc14 TaxID=890382 RepID=F0WCG4_9STRA|nr:hypothetical protein PITG_08794 [Albugo laibachii Nc14]|eukprot:CCA18879.1 hypothetical protein PITG_08794 [Albugo laibachii Nc14]
MGIRVLMETLESVFPHVPVSTLQRVCDMFDGNIEAASSYIVENEWRSIRASNGSYEGTTTIPNSATNESTLTAPMFIVSTQYNLVDNERSEMNPVQVHEPQEAIEEEDEGEDDEDEDEEDEEEDEDDDDENATPYYDSGDEAFFQGELLPLNKRIRVTATREFSDSLKSEFYWASFDGVVVQKSLIELLNINPSKLAHNRITLLNKSSKVLGSQEAFSELKSVLWEPLCPTGEMYQDLKNELKASTGQKRRRVEVGRDGFFAHFFSITELDVMWRSVLHAHLFNHKFGERLEFHSASGGVFVNNVSHFIMGVPAPYSRFHRRDFDELSHLHTSLSHGRAFGTGEMPLSTFKCCLILPCQAEEPEIFRIGRNVHMLLKLPQSLYYCTPGACSSIPLDPVKSMDREQAHDTHFDHEDESHMTEESFRQFAKYRIQKEEKIVAETKDGNVSLELDRFCSYKTSCKVEYSLQYLKLQGWHRRLSA